MVPDKKCFRFYFLFKSTLVKLGVSCRSISKNNKNIEDLTKIKDFSVDKTKIIDLYLEF